MGARTQEERVWIPHGDLMLDGRFVLGSGLAGLVCHPHPRYGGNMDNNVVLAAYSALTEIGASVLRFNFRESSLAHGAMAEGQEQLQQVKSAMDFLKSKTGCESSKLVLVGYSFGAWVGLRALLETEPILGWVAVAPPVGIWEFSFAKAIAGRKMILAGSQDSFCPLDLFQDLFRFLHEPKDMEILEGADHFFWGFEKRVKHVIEAKVSSWAEGLGDCAAWKG